MKSLGAKFHCRIKTLTEDTFYTTKDKRKQKQKKKKGREIRTER